MKILIFIFEFIIEIFILDCPSFHPLVNIFFPIISHFFTLIGSFFTLNLFSLHGPWAGAPCLELRLAKFDTTREHDTNSTLF